MRHERLRECAHERSRSCASWNFQSYLIGSVLSGNAGKYADINLQLYTDDTKAVELYLIDQRLAYRPSQSRLYLPRWASHRADIHHRL